MLVGWLFADLFLVLFIVAFSTQPTVALPGSKPTTSSAAHKASVSKKVLPKKSHGPAGLQSAPVDFKLPVSPAELASSDPTVRVQAQNQLLAGVHHELASRHLLDGKAGFVLIFATSVDGAADPIGGALTVASSIIPMLKHYNPAIFPAGMGGEGLWAGSGEYIHFQIFFYNQ
jgi:hypothetical protein